MEGKAANPAAPVVERYTDMPPGEFRQNVSRQWDALEEVHNVIISKVEDESFTPIEGAKGIACITAEVLGYKELHGTLLNSSPMDLLTAFRGAFAVPGYRGDT